MELKYDNLFDYLVNKENKYINSVGGVNGDFPTELARSDLRILHQSLTPRLDLRNFRLKKGCCLYIALVPSDFFDDFLDVTTFKPINDYIDKDLIFEGEFGSISGIKLIAINDLFVNKNVSRNKKTIYDIHCFSFFYEKDGEIDPSKIINSFVLSSTSYYPKGE